MYGYWAWRVCVSVFVVLIVQPVHAQEEGRLRGVVLDAQSQSPIEGATVLAAGTLYGALTNNAGEFSLGPLSANTYTVIVTAQGYTELVQAISIPADSTTIVTFLLYAAQAAIDRLTPVVDVPTGSWSSTELLSDKLAWLPGVYPGRVSGLDVIPNVRGMTHPSTALYLDGIRMLEAPGRPSTTMTLLPVSAVDEVLMASGPYGGAWGPRVQGGWYLMQRGEVSPAIEFAYDTRLRGLRTGAVYSTSRPTGYGELSGRYLRTGGYTDGNGTLQPGDAEAGRLQARGRTKLGAEHELAGQAGISVRSSNATKNEQVVKYSYSREQGVLAGANVQLSRQQWTGPFAISQQSGRMAVSLRPSIAWDVDVGMDIIRTPFSQLIEQGTFAHVTHNGRRLGLKITGRADRITYDAEAKFGWQLQAATNWHVNRDVQVLVGVGRRTGIFPVLPTPSTVQMDVGMRIDRFSSTSTVRAWTRWEESRTARGFDMYLLTPLLENSVELMVTATAIDFGDLRAVWGRAGVRWQPVGEFLDIGANLDVASRTRSTRAWYTSSVWIELAGLRRMRLRIAALNLFDRAYRWFESSSIPPLAEPGRSLQIAARFGI